MINENRLKEVVQELNVFEAERLRADGYTNSCFFNPDGSLTKDYSIKYLIKKKWAYINFGTSGAFMVKKDDGNIFNIDGYGVPNLAKFRGNIDTIDINELHKNRYYYLRG